MKPMKVLAMFLQNMVSEPTHMDGVLLDHLYSMKQFLLKKCKFHTVKNIYFRS